MIKQKPETYFELLKAAKAKAKTQKALTTFLREHQFVFVENHILEHYETKLNILPKHQRYNFMVIQNSDESYDDTLAFGFKLKGHIPDKIQVYFNYNFLETWMVPLGVVMKNFRKLKIGYKYNQDMPFKLRRLWKSEHEKLMADPTLKPSEFYKEWADHVTIL
jgi:hypothetical protein